MWRRWAGPVRVWLVSGGYLMLLMPGLYLGTPVAWRLSVGCTALLALCAWLMVLTRLRVFSDTPMSVVASAAQGYVAIRGSGRQFEGYPVFAPHRGVPASGIATGLSIGMTGNGPPSQSRNPVLRSSWMTVPGAARLILRVLRFW